MKPIKIYNSSNKLTIDWTLNTLCTYKCSYCNPQLYNGKNVFKSKEEDRDILLNFLNTLKLQVGDRGVHFLINGGEPTISPVFETLIDFIDDAGWYAYVNTNGSRSMEFWKEYAKKIFKVTVSYHPETADDEIFEKVKYIGTQTNVGVFTLMFPPVWDKAVSAYNRFSEMNNVTIGASRVFRRDTREISTSYDYSPEQLTWLEEHKNIIFKGNVKNYAPGKEYGQTSVEYDNGSIANLDEVEFVNQGKNQFRGWSCTMGTNHLFIDTNWNIKTATCSSAITIGNVETFTNLLNREVLCNDNYCMCTADVMIPKYL